MQLIQTRNQYDQMGTRQWLIDSDGNQFGPGSVIMRMCPRVVLQSTSEMADTDWRSGHGCTLQARVRVGGTGGQGRPPGWALPITRSTRFWVPPPHGDEQEPQDFDQVSTQSPDQKIRLQHASLEACQRFMCD